MRSFSQLVFDDTIHDTVPVYTDARLNELLGDADNLTIQATADEVAIPSNLTIQIEHSSDGRYWDAKNATAEIPITGMSPGSTATLNGYDASTNPSLGRARLKITLGSGFGTPAAHVKIHVCGRIK